VKAPGTPADNAGVKPARVLLLLVPLVLGGTCPALAARKPSAPPPADDRGRFARLSAQVNAAFDSARGGYVAKDGRPAESAMELGLRRNGEGETDRAQALHTLGWTVATLMDTMSGGFAERRPASGADAAAFAMRTDINARRLELLTLAWKTTGDDRWRERAVRLAGYMDRILLDGRGGFVAAQVGDRGLVPAANGVAIHAWMRWAAATGDPRARDFALRSIDRVWDTCHDPIGVLLRRGDFGEVTEWPQLADQAEMGRALLFSWQVCGRAQDLVRARALAQMMVDRFEDKERGGFLTQAQVKKDGAVRRAARIAEENARAALFLAELSAATAEPAWSAAMRRTVTAFERDQERVGLDAADWALALMAALQPEKMAPTAWVSASEPSQAPSVVRFKGPKQVRSISRR
jgi:uncharacterized protein YyaL (SSP411 family)